MSREAIEWAKRRYDQAVERLDSGATGAAQAIATVAILDLLIAMAETQLGE